MIVLVKYASCTVIYGFNPFTNQDIQLGSFLETSLFCYSISRTFTLWIDIFLFDQINAFSSQKICELVKLSIFILFNKRFQCMNYHPKTYVQVLYMYACMNYPNYFYFISMAFILWDLLLPHMDLLLPHMVIVKI